MHDSLKEPDDLPSHKRGAASFPYVHSILKQCIAVKSQIQGKYAFDAHSWRIIRFAMQHHLLDEKSRDRYGAQAFDNNNGRASHSSVNM